jgi:hypothetical protein
MEIKVVCKSLEKREFIESVAFLYARMLNIEANKVFIEVKTVPGLIKSMGYNGGLIPVDSKNMCLLLDSRLDIEQMLITLAHEMVHAKQYAKGQLRQRVNKKGNAVYTWLGREFKTSYFDSPWELEAFKRERVMANRVAAILSKI